MNLQLYKEKRNFNLTPEPSGKKTANVQKWHFVVQRHAASHLHYDFRLEMEGVLKSWAVPKGPSMKAGERRLAVMVEDHPLDYGKFYGVIPEGNYGAGVVDIWDEGTYEPLDEPDKGKGTKSLLTQLKKGDLKFILRGKHLKGAFALVRMKDGQKKNWLLIKKKDKYAIDKFNIEKIKSLNEGSKNKTGNPESKKQSSKTAKATGIEKVWPKLQKPMLAKLTTEVHDQKGWLYEMKFDGYRALAKINKGKVKLISRNGSNFNEMYPSLVKELQKIKHEVILDGEIVIEDKNGVSDFQLLQNYGTTKSGTLKFYVFDILFFDGYTITTMPLVQRKELLTAFFKKYKFKHIHETAYVEGKGKALFKKYAAKGQEGIIAKDGSAPYTVGMRTDAWMKIKTTHVQEAVICGYTAPQNSRQYFGSLILGLFEKGKLRYVGNCGTGFTDASLKELHSKLSKLKTDKNPFTTKPDVTGKKTHPDGLFGRGKPTWLKPKLVCNVKFQEWTSQGNMRIPVFMGLRTDKQAKGIIKEEEISNMKGSRIKKDSNARTKGFASARRVRLKDISKRSLANAKIKNPLFANKKKDSRVIKIGGKQVQLTNTAKIYWPGEGIAKGELIDYYARMAKYMLPYLKNRPQSLNRFPNGISAQGFYQKDMDVKNLPGWVHTEKIYSKHKKRYIDYLICNNAATLVYMANLGCIEINPWHSRYSKADYPDYMMIDLDPGNIDFVEVVNAALVIKKICDELKIRCFCKTSGATGLHVFIPLDARYTYNEVKIFARWMANTAHVRLPHATSVERMTAKRKNKVYLDFLQNSKGQTIAAAYSVRPRKGATVSTPLSWREVNSKLDPRQFTMYNIEKRIAEKGDLWKGILGKPVDLKKILNEIKRNETHGEATLKF